MNDGIEEVTIADIFFRYKPTHERDFPSDSILLGQERGRSWGASIREVRDFANDLSRFLAEVQRAEE